MFVKCSSHSKLCLGYYHYTLPYDGGLHSAWILGDVQGYCTWLLTPKGGSSHSTYSTPICIPCSLDSEDTHGAFKWAACSLGMQGHVPAVLAVILKLLEIEKSLLIQHKQL